MPRNVVSGNASSYDRGVAELDARYVGFVDFTLVSRSLMSLTVSSRCVFVQRSHDRCSPSSTLSRVTRPNWRDQFVWRVSSARHQRALRLSTLCTRSRPVALFTSTVVRSCSSCSSATSDGFRRLSSACGRTFAAPAPVLRAPVPERPLAATAAWARSTPARYVMVDLEQDVPSARCRLLSPRAA